MADKSLIKIKRSAVSGNAPNANNIVEGELALNTADQILYSRGGDDIFEIGANVSSLSIGGTEIIDSSGVWQGSSSGIKGEAGQKGQKGEVGQKGQKGEVGQKGQKGEVGQKGQKGEVGQKGQKGEVGAKGSQGNKGQKGEVGAKGQQGNFGGASFEYEFINTTNANVGPGDGHFKILNSNALNATAFMIDDEDINGTDIQSYLRTVDDSTSTIKGHVRISKIDDSEKFVLYTISSITENVANFTISVSGVSGSLGTGSFTDGERHIITFARTGDQGQKGEAGAKGETGDKGEVGSKGQKGEIGAKGAQGEKGQKGEVGAKGAQGEKGQKGEIGEKGQKGEVGQKGQKGEVGQKGQKGEVGAKGQKGEVGQKGQKGEVGEKGQKGEVGQKGQKGEVGQKGQKGEVGEKGQKGAGFDTATNVIPTGGIGSGEHELFDEDGELVGQVWATSLKYTRTIETSLGTSYPSSTTGAGFASTTTSGLSEFRINNGGSAEQRAELNAVSVNDTVLVRSTTNKGRWFIARIDIILRSSGSGIDGIGIRYNHSEAKTNTSATDYSTMESYLGGDTVEISFFNDHATGRYLHDEARINVGNGSYFNTAKIRLNGEYHAGTVNNLYPINIGTLDNYHGDLYSSRRSLGFSVQSSQQGFVWRYNSMNSSYQAGMSLRSDGRLNVAYGIKVGGGISDTGNVSSTYRLYVSGQIYSTSNISAYSDKRAKENIKPITDGLDKVLKLEGVYYNMKEGHSPNEDHTRPRVGVLAQDVQKILPEVVTYAEEEDMYSVDYGNITAVLIEAIKDQQKIIESLSERISKLEK